MKSKQVLILLITILVIIQFIPLSYNSQEKEFMGISFNIIDTNTYFSFMNQAAEGHFLFTNKFTPEPVPYIIFNPVWLVMGWITLLLPPLFVWYLFKLAFVLVFVYLISALVRLAVKKDEFNVTMFFVLLGSGIGYLIVLIKAIGIDRGFSADLWDASINSTALVLSPVHSLISVCLMIMVVIAYLKFWESKKPRLFWIFSSLTLLLGFVHLFDVITLALCFGFYMLWRFFTKRDTLTDILKYNIFYALVSLPAFIYTFYLYGMNPYFQAWNAQNILDAPKLHHLLFGYFFPLIFALVYSVNRIKAKKANDIEVILFSWMFSGLILLYSPLNIQRRFLEGLNIPIMLLGSLGFMRVVLPFFQKEIHKLTNLNKKTLSLVLIILTLILISPTSFYWLYKVSTSVRQDVPVSDYSVPYYLEKEEVEALNWLKSNTDKEAVVISGYGIGNYVPRISGNRVFLGHWAQTIDYEEKKTQVNMFYSTSDDNYRRVLLEQYNIKYVYYGIEEQKLGTLNSHYLEKVFENSKINIYALI